MRNAIALLLATMALAGCNQRPGNLQNAAAGSALATPGPRPESRASAGPDADPNFRQRYRDINIASCVRSAQARSARGDGAPPGTDFARYCTCTVDGAMEGLTTEQMMNLRPGPREQAIAQQCAQEMGLRTNFSGDRAR